MLLTALTAPSDGRPHTPCSLVSHPRLAKSPFCHTYTRAHQSVSPFNAACIPHIQILKHLQLCRYPFRHACIRPCARSLNIHQRQLSSGFPFLCASASYLPATPFTLQLLSSPPLSPSFPSLTACFCAMCIISPVLIPAFQQPEGISQQCTIVQVERERERTTSLKIPEKVLRRGVPALQHVRTEELYGLRLTSHAASNKQPLKRFVQPTGF